MFASFTKVQFDACSLSKPSSPEYRYEICRFFFKKRLKNFGKIRVTAFFKKQTFEETPHNSCV